jgi:hypothetical protein
MRRCYVLCLFVLEKVGIIVHSVIFIHEGKGELIPMNIDIIGKSNKTISNFVSCTQGTRISTVAS